MQKNIFVIDELDPQANAMLQALYSRNSESALLHIGKAKKEGPKFMETFLVNYNHKSIGDCGSTTIFMECTSMLFAKAIQDWQLYSGQETSTRYIKMSAQPLLDPVNTEDSFAILTEWMTFYTDKQSAVNAHLQRKYPRKEGEDEKVYAKAINARVFDIMRGFLPAGITTQLSWHTNLRQAHDHLAILVHHPLEEVRNNAREMLEKLKEKYFESFNYKLYPAQEEYRAKMAKLCTYFAKKEYSGDFVGSHNVRWQELLAEYRPAVVERPQQTELPVFLEEFGSITSDFLLDFGSFRDIQRHRNGVCRMPLLETKFGFNKWYLEELPDDVRAEAEKLISDQIKAIEGLEAAPEIKQYYVAMGFDVPCRTTYGLPAAVYVIDLRSGRMIHPTLRKVVHKMYHYAHENFPELVFHADLGPSDFDVRRGLQDITKKE